MAPPRQIIDINSIRPCRRCKVEYVIKDGYRGRERENGTYYERVCIKCRNLDSNEYNHTHNNGVKKVVKKQWAIRTTAVSAIKKKNGKNYITNDELYYEIVVSLAMGQLTTKASSMLILLCNKIIKRFYYTDPQLKEDCLSRAQLQVFTFWYNYNEYDTNPFAFYTEVIKRGIAAGYRENKKQKGMGNEYVQIYSLDRSGPEGEGIYNI